MTAADATAAPGTERHTALKLIAGGLLALKVAALLFVNPIADEAYYWLWSQHPAISYFDHPPLNAWLTGLVNLVLGRSVFSLRLLTLVSFIGMAWIFMAWAKRLAGAAWEGVFWRSLIIYLAAPTFGVYTSIASGDHLLLLLTLLSAHFFLGYLVDVQDGRPARTRALYFGAICLGLAGLAKYNAVFMGAGLVIYIVVNPRLRHLLGNPHLWLAGLLAIAMQAPILVWNLEHGFASFRFHLVERHEAGFLSRIDFRRLGEFVLVTLLTTSPFFVWGMGKFLLRPLPGTFGRTAWGLASCVFYASTLTFLVVSLTDEVYWWWALLGYIMIVPFLGEVMKGRWLFFGHLVFGTLLTLFQLISTSVVPLLFYLDRPDPTRSRNYGWELLAGPVAEAVAKYDADFVASGRWTTTSMVGFATGDADVVALSPERSQFSYWLDPEARRGQDAVVVLYDDAQKADAEARFESLTPIGTIPIDRMGFHFGDYNLYYAEGFSPP